MQGSCQVNCGWLQLSREELSIQPNAAAHDFIWMVVSLLTKVTHNKQGTDT
jgi:hypothetical protein